MSILFFDSALYESACYATLDATTLGKPEVEKV